MLSKDIGHNNNEDKGIHDDDNNDDDKDTDVPKKMSSITEVDLPVFSIVIRLWPLPCASSPLLVTMIPLMGDDNCGEDDDDGGLRMMRIMMMMMMMTMMMRCKTDI